MRKGCKISLDFNGVDSSLRYAAKGGSLTFEQKQQNKIISGIRMTVEHAIGGMKRFKSTVDIYRNKAGQDDIFLH